MHIVRLIAFVLGMVATHSSSVAQFVTLDRMDSNFIDHIRTYQKAKKIILKHESVFRKAFLKTEGNGLYADKKIIDSLANRHKGFLFIKRMFEDSLLTWNEPSVFVYDNYDACRVGFLTTIRYRKVNGSNRIDKRYCIMRFHPKTKRLYDSPYNTLEVITRTIKPYWSYLLSML